MGDGIYHLRVAGASFCQRALSTSYEGERVVFVHEPDNPHDELALRIETGAGQTIGYVPKRSFVRAIVHEDGRGLAGVIASVGEAAGGLVGAVISVAICDDEVCRRSYYTDRAPPEPPRGGFRYWVRNQASSEPGGEARIG